MTKTVINNTIIPDNITEDEDIWEIIDDKYLNEICDGICYDDNNQCIFYRDYGHKCKILNLR